MHILLLAFLAVAAFELQANAEASNPYVSVAQRNVFGLKAPEIIATNPPTPFATVKVFGIVSLFGYRQVIVQIGGTNYILRESEVRDGVEIVKIQAGGTIEVTNRGTKQLIADFGARKPVD